MDALELIEIIAAGETSTVQFKEALPERSPIEEEMIAMSNSKGGMIIIGVDDKSGNIKGLDYDSLQKCGSALSNAANEKVRPVIYITTEVVKIQKKGTVCNVLVVYINEGTQKPYKTTKGEIFIKQGADKRRVVDNGEQIRLFQESGLLYVDEKKVPNTNLSDINKDKVVDYVKKITESDDVEVNDTTYKNLSIITDNRLTLAGLLFFSNDPQKYRPAFCIKAVSFVGNDIGGTEYRDSEDIKGTIPSMYVSALSFLERNLKHVQNGQNFNTEGELEVSRIALEEIIQNSLTHRDYTKNAPIRLLIFDNRIEIISPGALPNSLTIESIKMGNAVVRNNLISSFSTKILNYRGLGSGIIRAIKNQPNIELYNDKGGVQFIVKIPRA